MGPTLHNACQFYAWVEFVSYLFNPELYVSPENQTALDIPLPKQYSLTHVKTQVVKFALNPYLLARLSLAFLTTFSHFYPKPL